MLGTTARSPAELQQQRWLMREPLNEDLVDATVNRNKSMEVASHDPSRFAEYGSALGGKLDARRSANAPIPSVMGSVFEGPHDIRSHGLGLTYQPAVHAERAAQDAALRSASTPAAQSIGSTLHNAASAAGGHLGGLWRSMVGKLRGLT